MGAAVPRRKLSSFLGPTVEDEWQGRRRSPPSCGSSRVGFVADAACLTPLVPTREVALCLTLFRSEKRNGNGSGGDYLAKLPQSEFQTLGK